jgi:hypothetical protein
LICFIQIIPDLVNFYFTQNTWQDYAKVSVFSSLRLLEWLDTFADALEKCLVARVAEIESPFASVLYHDEIIFWVPFIWSGSRRFAKKQKKANRPW